jgi:hypothetical protein
MGSRKRGWILVGFLAMMLLVPPVLWAQWGPLRRGLDTVRGGPQQATPREEPQGVADEKTAGPGLATTTTFRNTERPFSYTMPAGWRLEAGNPTGNRPTFMIPGTTAAFQFHFIQNVPSFPRKAAVDAGYKQSMEEMSIGKYLSVKRRNQGDVIGWEVIETEKGGGGFQRIIWQCYDKQNYYYNFMAASEPSQFPRFRAELQRVMDSIRFSR